MMRSVATHRCAGFHSGVMRWWTDVRILAVLAVLGGLGSSSGAEALSAQAPRLRSAVDTTSINVGDRLRLRVVVDHPDDWVVVWPDSVAFAPFELVELRLGEPDQIEGGVRSRAEYVLTSFELGELDIPSFPVVVTSGNGEEVSLDTDPFRIGVLSVGIDESGQIRDIKGPLSLPRRWWMLALWGLAALLFLLGARYVLGRRRRRSVPQPLEAPPPPRPFHELAYEALDALAASPLLAQGEVKRFHIRLSEIIREYIEGQLSVPAMEMTTSEVVEGLRGAAMGDGICREVDRFLTRCDLVKFAKLVPTDDASLGLLQAGRSLVDQTSGWESQRPVRGEQQAPSIDPLGDGAERSEVEPVGTATKALEGGSPHGEAP